MRYVKTEEGRPSFTATIAAIAFVAVIGKLLVGGVTLAYADWSFGFGELDGGLAAAVLTPCLGAYIGRRYTERRYAGGRSRVHAEATCEVGDE